MPRRSKVDTPLPDIPSIFLATLFYDGLIGLKRLVARCSGFWSYRLAAENLEEFCGIRLSHTLIGDLADETAGELATRIQDNPDIRNTFQAAQGETEFQMDGTCVNTRNDDGKAQWREMKVGALVKRECGENATPSEWETRKLPEPTAVSAFAAIESKGGVSGTLSVGASSRGGGRRDIGLGGWCLVDLESCGDGVWPNGGVLGHLSCGGTPFVVWQGVVWVGHGRRSDNRQQKK